MKSKNRYAEKKRKQGADSYGAWSAGVQLRSDIVAGHVLTYDARKGVWS